MQSDNHQRFLVAIGIVSAVVLGLAFLFASPRSAKTLGNVTDPTKTEPIMDFSCDPLPCVINGQKTNGSGALLETKTYNLTISSNQINGLPTVGIAANKGDILILNFAERDKPAYYFFIPRISVGHEASDKVSFPWVVHTENFGAGDYPVMLQDSLDPAVAVPNFQAIVIRVQ